VNTNISYISLAAILTIHVAAPAAPGLPTVVRLNSYVGLIAIVSASFDCLVYCGDIIEPPPEVFTTHGTRHIYLGARELDVGDIRCLQT
jgi:hypothetical protein